MGFKSGRMRKFLFAMDKDKVQGLNPQEIYSKKSPAVSIQTSQPAEMSGLPSPKFIPPIGSVIKPTAKPKLGLPKSGVQNPIAVPALPGLPRFGKIRKFFR